MVGCSSSCSGCPNRCQVHWLHAALSQLLCVCVASPLFPLMPVAMGRLSLSSPLYIKKRLRGGWKIENLYFKPKKKRDEGCCVSRDVYKLQIHGHTLKLPPSSRPTLPTSKNARAHFLNTKTRKKMIIFQKGKQIKLFFLLLLCLLFSQRTLKGLGLLDMAD